jgi:hypothetical protein
MLHVWLTKFFLPNALRCPLSHRIHCFEGVTAVLFTVAISGYDACLVEDKDSVSLYLPITPLATYRTHTITFFVSPRTKCMKHSCCLALYVIHSGSEPHQ